MEGVVAVHAQGVGIRASERGRAAPARGPARVRSRVLDLAHTNRNAVVFLQRVHGVLIGAVVAPDENHGVCCVRVRRVEADRREELAQPVVKVFEQRADARVIPTRIGLGYVEVVLVPATVRRPLERAVRDVQREPQEARLARVHGPGRRSLLHRALRQVRARDYPEIVRDASDAVPLVPTVILVARATLGLRVARRARPFIESEHLDRV